MSQLPIQAVLPELLAAVSSHSQVILKAAPGAGKSTYFPLQLLLERSRASAGKIIMLEPRRLAARNIARYLAQQLNENVGQRVGYRVRGESKVSTATQLEVVTEGILTRMIQSDPELSGVDILIFDEFHERSIHADTALAFSLEIQQALRDDLKLVVMSATLDQHALLAVMPEAKYIESKGRSFPVQYRYHPLAANDYLVPFMVRQIERLMAQEEGSLLAFLPGVAAIKQVAERLELHDDSILICPLYGQLSFAEQQRAINPCADGLRKVVLATNIAETSLTIEGIRLVVDSGLERIARFDLNTGITRLQQQRIARSSAEQRAGRAGRLQPGICVRLYSEQQLAQQPEVPEAEILHSDLAGLVLEVAYWGAGNVSELSWLDNPPTASLSQACALLRSLGLMDDKAQLTAMGRAAHELGVDARIAAMLLQCAHHKQQRTLLPLAIAASALLEEPQKQVTDMQLSLQSYISGRHNKQKIIHTRCRQLAAKLQTSFALDALEPSLLGCVLLLAFPDRVAQRRNNGDALYRLANGHGARLMDDDPLASHAYLVAADVMRSNTGSSQIYQAAPLDLAQSETLFKQYFSLHEVVDWDERRGQLVASEQTLLGKLVIRRRELAKPGAEKMTQALLTYVRRKGLSVLNWDDKSQALLQRIRCALQWLPEESWPPMDDEHLLAELEIWLEPYMNGVTSVKALQKINLSQALLARLGWPLNQQLDEWLPKTYLLPTGAHKSILYQQGSQPVLSVRMQEMFGEKQTPVIAKGRQKLVLELLSPARRPLQVTQDLAGFWAGSYKEVQKEMKGRYPKHIWPDDPGNHVATTKTKRQFNQ